MAMVESIERLAVSSTYVCVLAGKVDVITGTCQNRSHVKFMLLPFYHACINKE